MLTSPLHENLLQPFLQHMLPYMRRGIFRDVSCNTLLLPAAGVGVTGELSENTKESGLSRQKIVTLTDVMQWHHGIPPACMIQWKPVLEAYAGQMVLSGGEGV